MFKTKSVPAKLITKYCPTCKTEQEFYDLKGLKVCTQCLWSIKKPKGRGKE